MKTLDRTLLALPALAALAQVSFGQSVLYTFDGDSACDFFGNSVSGAGDVNGDGYADVIVGAPYDDNNGNDSGSARVFSGKDGSVLYTFEGNSTADKLGFCVSSAGDVNGDGYADVIVTVPGDLNSSVQVISGKDGSVLYSIGGFVRSVSGARDVNGDNVPDLIIGDPAGAGVGSARVLSGADGVTLHTFYGDNNLDYLGWSVSGAGDVNADGYADVICGMLLDDNNGKDSGSARVFSGKDGSILYTFDGDSKNDGFGYSVSGAGDVNGDGFADLIVGAPYDKNDDRGSAWVFSGKDGSILYTFYGTAPGDWLGFAVSCAGDVDEDSFDDLIVGAPFDDFNGLDSGSARVFSGVDGSLIYRLDGGSKGDRFGFSVSGVGYVDADCVPDLIVGAPRPCDTFLDSAWVFSGKDDPNPPGTNYCGPANLNSTGQSAEVSALGSNIVACNLLFLVATDLPPNQFGYFLNSQTQGFVPNPGGSQGNLCLGGSIGRYNRPGEILSSGAGGTFSLILDLTDTPQPTGSVSILPGETWNFQAWFRDNNPGPTSNFTDGVSITFL